MKITLEQAEIAQKPVLRHLLELYIYDFSEVMGWDVDDSGLFGYRYLDHYWTEDGRVPYLLRADGRLAGFALVRQTDGVTQVGEFFVMRRYRRHGIGREAARLLFAQFPGAWRLDVLPENASAEAFWRRVITATTTADVTEGIDARGKTWFAFEVNTDG